MKKTTKRMACIMAGLLSMTVMFSLTGCGKKPLIPVLTYQINEDDTVTVTGLTDKGKTNAKVTIPATIEGKQVVSIENEAFKDNQNVNQVIIEEGITKIDANTFLNCGYLDQIQFPSTLKEIGTNMVKNSLWEKNILDQQNEIVVNHILIKVKENLDTYDIPDEVQTIAPGVFYENETIKQISMNQDLKNISAFAFAGCTGLEEIKLPDNIESIGYGAFSGCKNLIIEMKKDTAVIESEAFDGVEQIIYR